MTDLADFLRFYSPSPPSGGEGWVEGVSACVCQTLTPPSLRDRSPLSRLEARESGFAARLSARAVALHAVVLSASGDRIVLLGQDR
jgi:hypothetical protein